MIRAVRSVLAVAFFVLLLGDTSTTVSAAERGQGLAQPATLRVYIGTYTGGDSRGIYRSELDLGSGNLQPAKLAAEMVNPSFLAVHPNRRYLYAVGEVSGFAGKPAGAVSGFSIDEASGKLTLLGSESSGGTGPCHLAVDASGGNVLVANYGGGSAGCLPLGNDGRPGPAKSFIQHQGSSINRRRQQGPHAHCVNLTADNRFALVADLGLDKILVYRFDAVAGKLAANNPPWFGAAPGAGPRHLALHPTGRYVYVVNELDSTVAACRFDARVGVLTLLQTISTLPQEFEGNNSTAEIHAHPTGRFVYASNRGHDSIVIYAVDAETGRLAYVGHESTQGKTPRNFSIDPTGTYLLAANQATDNVVVFRIDRQSGRLRATGQSLKVPSPVCVALVPLGR